MPSSVIRRFHYDPLSRRLEVVFVSGRHYRYCGVPEAVGAGITRAFSKGAYFNSEIRDRYPFERIGAASADVAASDDEVR